MSKLKSPELGESVCLKLKGKTEEGILLEKTKKGIWVIFYNEIPGVSIGDGKFLIYPNADARCVERLKKESQNHGIYRFAPEPYQPKVRDNKWYETCMRTHKLMRSNW